MDINMFIQLINGVGFPIAACIALSVFIVWDKKSRRSDREKEREEQAQLFRKLNDTVENNTKMVENLLRKIESEV